MWGFGEKRMQGERADFQKWLPVISKIDSPFPWERKAIKARLARICGFKAQMPLLPDSFRLSPNVELNAAGGVDFLNCEDGVMGERLQGCQDLDAYFFLKYWGRKVWSRGALRLLQYWDMFMPRPKLRMNMHRAMWVLWVIGIFFSKERWRRLSLAALMLVVVSYAVCLCVVTDNFGGRLALYDRAYLWLGALCGIQALIAKIKEIKYTVI